MSNLFLPIDVQDIWAEGNQKVTDRIEEAVDYMRVHMQVMWAIMNRPVCEEKPFPADKNCLANVFHAHSKWNPLTIAPAEEDLVVGKARCGIGSNPEVIPYLTEMGVETIYIAGFMTMQCVFSSAEDLAKEFNVVLLEDLTADGNDEIHMGNYKNYFKHRGIEVSSYDALKSQGFSPR